MTTSNNRLIEEWISDFNPGQTEAYELDANCVALAGPGSGKTRVLVAKVARLLGQRTVGPRGVACVTYNNEAVREMQKRLAQLGIRRDRRLFIGTVHSFCLACVVAPFGHLFRSDLPSKLTVASLRQKNETIQEALNELKIVGRIEDWGLSFDRYRRTHVLRDSDQWNADPEMASVIEMYESLLRSKGLLDFDDMVLIALDLIRRKKFVRDSLEARFPFLVVDEYQDLGFPLHLIVRMLIRGTDTEVFAVGDPDQSIYGFTGADPEYLRTLANDPAFHRVDLEMNYRCAQQIIDGSQIALSPEEPRNYRSARDKVTGNIEMLECLGGLSHQAETIATQLLPMLNGNGIINGKIAILHVDRWDGLVLSKALNDAGIKYAGESDQRYPRTPFTRWLEDVAIWCSLYPDTQEGPIIEDLSELWMELKSEAGIVVDPSLLKERRNFFEIVSGLTNKDMPLLEWLETLEASLGLENCLSNRFTNLNDLEDWHLINRRCGVDEALEEFNVDDFARCGGRRPDTVTLTTLHSSKGREFEVVIIPGLEEGRLPGFYATSAGALAEARRVFYVGITRAKDAVYLLYSGWYENRYGRKFSNGPSPFIFELQEQLEPGSQQA